MEARDCQEVTVTRGTEKARRMAPKVFSVMDAVMCSFFLVSTGRLISKLEIMIISCLPRLRGYFENRLRLSRKLLLVKNYTNVAKISNTEMTE